MVLQCLTKRVWQALAKVVRHDYGISWGFQAGEGTVPSCPPLLLGGRAGQEGTVGCVRCGQRADVAVHGMSALGCDGVRAMAKGDAIWALVVERVRLVVAVSDLSLSLYPGSRGVEVGCY